VSPTTSVKELLEDIKVIDTDTHVVEPYDLWTSRISVQKWGDKVPHVAWDDKMGREVWLSGDEFLRPATSAAFAGYDKPPPETPRRWSEVNPVTYRPRERLALMTEYGIHAAVLYPNVPGFGAGKFSNVAGHDGELALEMLKAYNDFLIDEYYSIAPDRYIPVMALPFWDIDASIAEMARCKALGHRGLIFSQQPDLYHCPRLADRHWDRLWAAAQEMQLPVNFHTGSGDTTVPMLAPDEGRHTNYASACALIFMGNAQAVASVIGGGICHRFPDLKFVSVESGVGWVPFLLQGLDWMWKESGVTREHPEYDLLPTDYFRRQMYACFWFEHGQTLQAAMDYLGEGAILYETDFPHPTSMSPGPTSQAVPAKEFIAASLGDLSETTLRKILHDNAATLYKTD
jgi:uncharacterized protein